MHHKSQLAYFESNLITNRGGGLSVGHYRIIIELSGWLFIHRSNCTAVNKLASSPQFIPCRTRRVGPDMTGFMTYHIPGDAPSSRHWCLMNCTGFISCWRVAHRPEDQGRLNWVGKWWDFLNGILESCQWDMFTWTYSNCIFQLSRNIGCTPPVSTY